MSWLDRFFTGGYKNVASAGTLFPQETTLNFTSGATVTDDPSNGRTNVSISATVLPGAAGQGYFTNASLAAVWATYSGDVNMSTATAGQATVVGIQSKPVPAPSGTNTYLQWSGTVLQWATVSTGALTSYGADLAGSNATNQWVASISGGGGGGGTVNVTASTLAFQQTSSITSPTATTLTVDGPTLHLGTALAGTVNVGNTTANTLVTLISGTGGGLEGEVGGAFVFNFSAGSGDYVKLGASQSTQLTPGSLATTSGSLAVTGFTSLVLGSNNGSNTWTFDSTGQLQLSAASAPNWAIFQAAQPSSATPSAGNTFQIHAGAGGANTGTNATGANGAILALFSGFGGASTGTAANSNSGDLILGLGSPGGGGSGAAGVNGFVKLRTGGFAGTDRLVIDWNRTTTNVLTLQGQQATTITTTSGNLALDSAATATLGAATATTVTVGNTSTTTQTNIQSSGTIVFWASASIPVEINASAIYPSAGGATQSGSGTLYWNGVYSSSFQFPAGFAGSGSVVWSGNNSGLTGNNTVVSAQNSSGAAGANTGGTLQLLSGGVNGGTGNSGNIVLGFGGTTSSVTFTATSGAISLTKDLTNPGISQATLTAAGTAAGFSITTQGYWTGGAGNAGTLTLDTGVPIGGGTALIQIGATNATKVSIGSPTASGATITLNVPVGGQSGGSGTAFSFIATSVALTSGVTNTLTNAQYACPSIKFTGTLAASSTTTIVFPSTDGAVWFLDFSGVSFGSSAVIHLQANTVVWSTSIASASTGIFIRYSAGAGKLYGNTQGQ